MNIEGLQVFSHEAMGYKALLDFQSWRVALLNAMPMYLPDGLTYFDRHLETAEAFVLLAGSCALLLAGTGSKPSGTSCIWLKEGEIYNVCPNTWHTLFMMPGSKLAVIENSNTCIDNSPRYYFSEEERKELIPKIELQ